MAYALRLKYRFLLNTLNEIFLKTAGSLHRACRFIYAIIFKLYFYGFIVGTFGQMEIYMPYTVSKLYMLFFAVGIISVFFVKETFDLKKKIYVVQRKAVGNDRWKIKTKVISREWNKEGIFHLMMVFLIMIPVFLFLYYVYYSDNQPQGRYLMPALYPLMYFVTLGWNNILTKTVKNEKVRSLIYRVLTVLLVISPFACWAFLILP